MNTQNFKSIFVHDLKSQQELDVYASSGWRIRMAIPVWGENSRLLGTKYYLEEEKLGRLMNERQTTSSEEKKD